MRAGASEALADSIAWSVLGQSRGGMSTRDLQAGPAYPCGRVGPAGPKAPVPTERESHLCSWACRLCVQVVLRPAPRAAHVQHRVPAVLGEGSVYRARERADAAYSLPRLTLAGSCSNGGGITFCGVHHKPGSGQQPAEVVVIVEIPALLRKDRLYDRRRAGGIDHVSSLRDLQSAAPMMPAPKLNATASLPARVCLFLYPAVAAALRQAAAGRTRAPRPLQTARGERKSANVVHVIIVVLQNEPAVL